MNFDEVKQSIRNMSDSEFEELFMFVAEEMQAKFHLTRWGDISGQVSVENHEIEKHQPTFPGFEYYTK